MSSWHEGSTAKTTNTPRTCEYMRSKASLLHHSNYWLLARQNVSKIKPQIHARSVNVHIIPMNGAAKATNEASPTPTNILQTISDQNPTASPQPNVASIQVLMPMAMSLKAL